MRSAFFLGVDAIAFSSRHIAPFSPVALKSSAGASEAIQLLSVDNPEGFLDACLTNNWAVYATGPRAKGSEEQKALSVAMLGKPLRKRPAILLLGGEGEGLRSVLKKKADYFLSIPGTRAGLAGLDSLSVSAAAAILCEAFLRRTAPIKKLSGTGGNVDTDHKDNVDTDPKDQEEERMF